jgi:hypothetical protein
MESQTEAKYRQIRAVVTVLIMPVTIIAGYAMGYLVCLGVGYLFFDNYDRLLVWDKDGRFGILCWYGDLFWRRSNWRSCTMDNSLFL